VLQKCANPFCSAQFRYQHQGKLFQVEIQYFENLSGEGKGKSGNGKRHVERCWLCDRCAAHVALRLERRRGLVIVSSLRDFEGSGTTVIPQLNPEAAAGIAGVLIRPLDLELTVSTRREAAR
jgi:hypothetical protein